MSKTHTVSAGETLKTISLLYYGVDSKYTLIIHANTFLRDRLYQANFATDGTPILYPGEVITIPGEAKNIVNVVAGTKKRIPISTADKNSITLIIEGKQYQFFTNYTITSNINTLDTITVESPFIDTEEYRRAFKAFNYSEVLVYYGTDLLMVGSLLSSLISINESSKTLSLTIYPKCGVLNDCPAPTSLYPVSYDGYNLKEIAEALLEPYGIGVEFAGDPGESFIEVAIEPTETVLQFLANLADERGFIFTNNSDGDLLFWKAGSGSAVESVQEGETPFLSCEPKFSPQSYFSEVTGIFKEDEEVDAISCTWKNPFLQNVFRPTVVEFDETTEDIEKAVYDYAGRMFGSVCSYTVTLNTHRTTSGECIKANMIFSVLAESSQIYRETDFLVSKVVLTRSPDKGIQAELTLVLPGAYSGTLPTEVPWEPEPKRVPGTFDTKTGLPTGGL